MELRALQGTGKIHTRLISRIRMMLGISAILAVITVYNLIVRPEDIALSLALIVIGLVLGLYVFSRMSVVTWDEETSAVVTGRMDVIGFAAIALYIAFEIGLRTYLKDIFPSSATSLILAAIFGTIFGRVIGTVIEIHRVYKTSQTI